MSAPASFRNKPIDRRRLSAKDRGSYKAGARNSAISKARAYKARLSAQQQRKPFATEQKPGSGGFVKGRYAQQERLRMKGDDRRRAESFRPENSISNEIYRELAT